MPVHRITKKKSKKSSLKAATGAVAARSGSRLITQSKRIVLPTEKTVPSVDPSDYIMCFFGQPGSGKTTFVNALADRVLFLSTDRGTRFQPSLRVECNSWEDFLEVLTQMEAEEAPEYQIVAIDHASDWANLAETYVLTKLGVESFSDLDWGKGWKAFKTELFTFMARLKALNCGIVFISHETTKELEVAGIKVDRCMPDLGRSAYNMIIPLCDIVGHCWIKPMKDKNNKRVDRWALETSPRIDLFAKDRTTRRKPSGERPWEPLDGEHFLSTFGG
jgi:phage nucleotide-binding protein